MKFIVQYLKQHKTLIIMLFLFFIVFLVSFLLYHLPVEAVIYPIIICIIIGIIYFTIGIRKTYLKHIHLSEIKRLSDNISLESFPVKKTQDDLDYCEIIETILEEKERLENRMNVKYSDAIEYYTTWVHQIKTPIASVRLNLQNDDSELSSQVLDDLFRIEQYVEMVLMFLRLDSNSTDYIFEEYDLDTIIRQAVKRFASQFIRKKIRLDYSELNTSVITDEKWLSFVIEQVLSNALKYTPSGTISIYLENQKTLCIRDTGIGIAPEDLPQIFNKGYTGYNGRSDKRASGIGLYLCRRICNNLEHTITADSTLEKGTVIKICLERTETKFE